MRSAEIWVFNNILTGTFRKLKRIDAIFDKQRQDSNVKLSHRRHWVTIAGLASRAIGPDIT